MAALTSVPVEEYLRTCYGPDREYVHGRLVERHVGDHDHSLLHALVGAELNARRRERGYRVFSAQRVRVSDQPRFRIPDLCVKALPYHKTPVLVCPDLVIEIVSPDDDPLDLLEKIGDYQAASIPYIWVVDPYKRTLVEAVPAGIRKPAGLVLATPLVGEVDFAALFQQLDEPAE